MKIEDKVLLLAVILVIIVFLYLISRNILRSMRMEKLAKLMSLKYSGGFKLFTFKEPDSKRHVVAGNYRGKNIEIYDQLIQAMEFGSYYKLVVRIDHRDVPKKCCLISAKSIKKLVDNYIDKG